jgi:hypothetical protein
VPAAAVIPAPIALLKVAAVKKLVVEYPASLTSADSAVDVERLLLFDLGVYCEQIRVLKTGFCLNFLAWNNKIRLRSFYWFLNEVMVNRNSWGHSYLKVRGEILRFFKDELMRRHLPRMFSLIKNESVGIKKD